MSSSSNRRRDLSPSRGGVGSSRLRMDRQPVVARITGTVYVVMVVWEPQCVDSTTCGIGLSV